MKCGSTCARVLYDGEGIVIYEMMKEKERWASKETAIYSGWIGEKKGGTDREKKAIQPQTILGNMQTKTTVRERRDRGGSISERHAAAPAAENNRMRRVGGMGAPPALSPVR